LRFKVEQALEVIGQSHERPFEADLGQAAQRKAAKTHRGFDDPEDRLDGLLSLSVTMTASICGQ
jgi:hypothetical protein